MDIVVNNNQGGGGEMEEIRDQCSQLLRDL